MLPYAYLCAFKNLVSALAIKKKKKAGKKKKKDQDIYTFMSPSLKLLLEILPFCIPGEIYLLFLGTFGNF